MKARALTVRAIALLAAGSAAIHQLRYAIGYGHDAGHELAAQGHAYLDLVLPFLVAIAFVSLAAMLRATPVRGPRWSLRRTWLVASGALVAAYCTQELLEGFIASGHPAGLAGVFGAGGWSAVVLAVPVGLLVALGLRGGDAVVAGAVSRLRPALPDAPNLLACAPRAQVRSGVRRIGGARGPPLLSVR